MILNIPGNFESLEQLPISIQRDYTVRSAIVDALSSDQQTVLATTKLIEESAIEPIHSISLELPIELPGPNNTLGTHSKELKEFAFDTYDSLQNKYGDKWGSWHISLYLSFDDDTQNSLMLGVFA